MISDDPSKPSGHPEKRPDQAAGAPPRVNVTPLTALVLSVLVLPGLGQILTGRKIRGALMAGLLALWLPAAIIKVGLDLQKVMPQLLSMANSETSLLGNIQMVMSPMAGSLIWLFLPLAAIWLWSLADSVAYIRRMKNE